MTAMISTARRTRRRWVPGLPWQTRTDCPGCSRSPGCWRGNKAASSPALLWRNPTGWWWALRSPRKYRMWSREILSPSGAGVVFVYLKGSKQMIEDRLLSRENHYFKASMIQTQFQALEVSEFLSSEIFWPCLFVGTHWAREECCYCKLSRRRWRDHWNLK